MEGPLEKKHACKIGDSQWEGIVIREGAARGQEGLGKKARTGKSDMRRVGGRDASWNKEREDNIGQNWTKACVCAIVQFLHWTELDNIQQNWTKTCESVIFAIFAMDKTG